MAYTTYTGGMTSERFCTYLKDKLFPTLKKDDIVIMDNMRSHHAKQVTELIQSSGVKVLYLPPYSPDMNPIEMLWSKLKSLLRSFKIRDPALLANGISMAFSLISQSDCKHWFVNDIY